MTRLGAIVGGGTRNVGGGSPTALGTYVAGGLIDTPAAFGWDPAFAIYQGAGRGYSCNLDVSTLIPSTASTIYVSPLGSDANPGTTPGAGAKLTLAGALGVAGTKTIWIQGGTYRGWVGASVTTDCAIRAYGDGPVTITADVALPSWSSSGDGAYEATTAQPFGVCDDVAADVHGIAPWLVPRASVAAVKSDGGWFWAANILTIKTADARAPDASIHYCPTGVAGLIINNVALNVYVEGIRFRLAHQQIYALTCNRLAIVNCDLRNAQSVGIRVQAAADAAYIIRCTGGGQYGGGGGFADFIDTGAAKALVWDCRGTTNGDINGPDAGLSCNGVSGHAGSKNLVLGGLFGGGLGPAVADAGAGLAMYLGTTCLTTTGGSDPANQMKSATADGAGGRTWHADCYLPQPIVVGGASADVITYLRNTGIVSSSGPGSVSTW